MLLVEWENRIVEAAIVGFLRSFSIVGWNLEQVINIEAFNLAIIQVLLSVAARSLFVDCLVPSGIEGRRKRRM